MASKTNCGGGRKTHIGGEFAVVQCCNAGSLLGLRRGQDFAISSVGSAFRIPSRESAIPSPPSEDLPDLRLSASSAWTTSCLSRNILKWFIPQAIAPPISTYCADRTFIERQAAILDGPLETLALYGMPPALQDSIEAVENFHNIVPGIPPRGLLSCSQPDQLPLPTMRVPEAKSLIYDSAKLARLDALLQELKAGDHRVLIYFQMTKMMDLMEEYLIYRQYKYLRLDGSSKLEDRRDMVMDWQTRFVRPF